MLVGPPAYNANQKAPKAASKNNEVHSTSIEVVGRKGISVMTGRKSSLFMGTKGSPALLEPWRGCAVRQDGVRHVLIKKNGLLRPCPSSSWTCLVQIAA